MIRGIGLDICEISRMEGTLRHAHFLTRFFSEGEQAYILSRGKVQAASAAGIFAAKEAFSKALGTGFTSAKLSDISVSHDALGAPEYILSGAALEQMAARGAKRAFLSITHDGGVAAAVCVLED